MRVALDVPHTTLLLPIDANIGTIRTPRSVTEGWRQGDLGRHGPYVPPAPQRAVRKRCAHVTVAARNVDDAIAERVDS
jgi:hypothetical protein